MIIIVEQQKYHLSQQSAGGESSLIPAIVPELYNGHNVCVRAYVQRGWNLVGFTVYVGVEYFRNDIVGTHRVPIRLNVDQFVLKLYVQSNL